MDASTEESAFKKIMQNTDTYKLNTHLAKLFVWVVVIASPDKYWYDIAYYTSYLFGMLSRQALFGNSSIRYQTGYRLNKLLSLFTRTGKAFDIPIKITGLEHLSPTTNGLAICTAHLPLIKVGTRAILDSGFNIDAIIAAVPGKDGKMSSWGTTKRVRIIHSINSNVLLKTRSVLKENGCVTLMIDEYYGKPLSPNMLHFCGKMGAKVVFLITDLADDHSVEVQLVLPPYPFCEDDDKVNKNLEVLTNLRNAILNN